MIKKTISVVIFIFLGSINLANAFQLSPVGTEAERRFAKRWGMAIRTEMAISRVATHNFAEPAHETLTQQIFGCDGDWADCADPDLEYAGPYVIAGVRWNDDPVFMLSSGEAGNLPCKTQYTVSFVTQTRCWVELFRDAEAKTRTNPEYFLNPGAGTYMTRSHFGDLQFLHAMAARDGETTSQTKERILMWAEFVWGIVEGKYKLDTNLRDIQITGWQNHFANGHTVQELFTMGRPWLRPHIKEVAFGSMLHLVQDSFAQGHVDRREPTSGQVCLNGTAHVYGHIREFHSYSTQDHEKHKIADSSEAAHQHVQLHDPDAINAGKRLREYLDQSQPAPWSDVRQFLSECLLVVDDENHQASAGDFQ